MGEDNCRYVVYETIRGRLGLSTSEHYSEVCIDRFPQELREFRTCAVSSIPLSPSPVDLAALFCYADFAYAPYDYSSRHLPPRLGRSR